jgi:two-component system cell cycle sensor histidine kinase/response regulator CckA
VIGSGVLALQSLFLAFGDASTRRRRRGLRRRLDHLDLPAAISGVDGKLEWSNQAMRAAFGDGHDDIAQVLGRGVGVDAGQVYRLAIRAREMGFAFEAVRSLQDGAMAVLSARIDEPKHFVWMVFPPDHLPKIEQQAGASAYEDAPFAHMRLERDGNATSNLQFREIYGDHPEFLASLIGDDHSPGLRRAVLPRNDDETRFSNICIVPSVDGEVGCREIFLFPAGVCVEAPDASETLDAVPVALMQFDFSGKLLWHNATAREMLGRELHPGMVLTDLVEPLGRSVDALIADGLTNEKGRREMVRLRGGSLDTFLQISLTRVAFGASPSLLAVLSDASELRLLEDKFAQSQKMEAVGKLAGGVAHDFNNVLTAISGHSDLLLLGKDALHQDYSDLMQIRQNTHRAAALVRQLLAFSRKQTLNPTLMSVQDVVSDTQYLLNRLIGEKVTLSLEHGRDLGAVRADHQQFEQALMNLVVNARDAMPNGGMITIATRNVTLVDQNATQGIDIPNGEYVEIGVSDNGAGIDPDLIDRIFDPFFTTKPVGEGTGLGLSTVYGIVKQSGGFIFAENRAEGGARFRILLPRAYPGTDDHITARNPPRVDRGDQTGTGAILLVEDEDPVRSFASRALRLRGYEVSEASSAEDAMEHLSDTANHVDLLVSDVVMPGMDGPTFAAHARKIRPGLRVVFISGYAEDSFRRNLVDHDFLFLPKPFSLTDLTAKVKEALDEGA